MGELDNDKQIVNKEREPKIGNANRPWVRSDSYDYNSDKLNAEPIAPLTKLWPIFSPGQNQHTSAMHHLPQEFPRINFESIDLNSSTSGKGKLYFPCHLDMGVLLKLW